MDLVPFFIYQLDQYNISGNDYPADIEFGNEIRSGSGRMILRQYNLEIE